MKWINAEQQVTVTIYDEEHEEHLEEIMTIETMLDAYTNEGCPTMYSEPERKKGKWIRKEIHSNWSDWTENACSLCGATFKRLYKANFCPNCGAQMSERISGTNV